MNSADTHHKRHYITGIACVLVAALGFSAKAVLIKAAYAYDVDAITLLTLRMALALPFFLLIAWVYGRKSPPRLERHDRLVLVGLGLLGYYLASYLDFIGLHYISAGLERMILFLYPTFVVILSAVFLRRPVMRHDYAALGLCYLGTLLVVMNEVAIEPRHLYLGSGLVFASAVAFAVFLVVGGRLMARTGTVMFTAYTMVAATIAVLVQFAATHRLSGLALAAPVYWLALAMAIGSTVVPAFLMTEGIRRIGAATGSIISSAGPVATLVLAYLFLGESLAPLQVCGALLVMAGITIVSLKKQA